MIDFQQRCKGKSMEKEERFQQMVLEQVNIYVQRHNLQSIPVLYIKHK